MVACLAGRVSMSGADRVRPSIAFRPRAASLRLALDFILIEEMRLQQVRVIHP
jgi:hypothetical protein